ncbi:MAG: lytic transglycosylase domain-containing protein [Syntrophotaleaceae bacterium]
MPPARLLKTALPLILLLLVLFASRLSCAFCFEEAGREYHISPELLWAIAKVESQFDPAAINYNSNGSYDFGVMQINSSWARHLGLKRWAALGDPCYNVKVGAWVLADCLQRYGLTEEGIGCYNAMDSGKRSVYAGKVLKALKQALAERGMSTDLQPVEIKTSASITPR